MSTITFTITNQLIDALKQGSKCFLFAGKLLSEIQEKGLWKDYGEHITNFEDYLKEVKLKRASAWNLIRTWREFGSIIEQEGLDVPYTTLTKLLPVARENKKEWLYKAQELPPKDLEYEINEAKGRLTPEKCEHPFDRLLFCFQCRECSKWHCFETYQEFIGYVQEHYQEKTPPQQS